MAVPRLIDTPRPGPEPLSPAPNRPPGRGISWQVWAGLATVYLFWGSTYLAIKFVIQTMPPLLSASGRFLLAALLLMGFALLRGSGLPTRRQALDAAVVGVLLIAGGNGGVMQAEQRLASGPTALLVAVSPLLMVVMAAAGTRAPIGRPVLVGLLVGLAGVGLLVVPAGAGHFDLLGAATTLGAATCWAAGSAYGSAHRGPESAAMGSGLQMLFGSLALALIAAIAGEAHPGVFAHTSLVSLGAVAYLVIFGSLVGFSAYSWLLQKAPISLVSTYAYVNPVVAVLLGALILGERIDLREVVAGGVILVAVALIARARSQAAALSRRPADEALTAA